MMTCEVCRGDGRYPVIDRYGRERYSIKCPDCLGSGEADEVEPGVAVAKQAAAILDAEYEAAIAERIRRRASDGTADAGETGK